MLPRTPQDIAAARWEDLEPHYHRLESEPVGGAWLREWSRLEDLIAEAASRARIAYYGDTQDQALQAAELRFTSEIKPRAAERSAVLAHRLLAAGYEEAGMEMVLRHLKVQERINRLANVPLHAEEAVLVERYTRLLGGLTVEWKDGVRIPRNSLLKFVESDVRDDRERAHRLAMWDCMSDDDRAQMSATFERLVGLRARIASNAGLQGYAEYAHQQRGRWDIPRADVDRLVDSLVEVWVPLARRCRHSLAQRLGVAALRPWDAFAPPRTALPEPYRDSGELVATYERIFTRLHPRLGEIFTGLRNDGLLDLDFRPNVPPIAFNSRLHASRRAHIFMSMPPTAFAVSVFAHELGHGFHFEESARLELHWQRMYGSAAAELASTTMQLLTLPYLSAANGGFYSDEGARVASELVLREAATIPLTYASEHLYECWVYSHPEATQSELEAQWRQVRELDSAGFDTSGLERYDDGARLLAAVPYMFPFYSVDYLIAWVGALQIWRNARRDPQGALNAYLGALALGNTRPLSEMYAAAGARLDLDRPALEELAGFLESQLGEIES
jgi:oligoendopeptidase F